MQIVETSHHQRRLWEVNQAAPKSGAACFDFCGRTFVIALSRSLDHEMVVTNERTQLGEPVGRLDIDGRRHLIYRQSGHKLNPESRPMQLTDVLTRRELEIALLISDGCSDKEIGRSLGISSYTVREHIRRTCAKLGVSRRVAVVSVVIHALSASPGVR